MFVPHPHVRGFSVRHIPILVPALVVALAGSVRADARVQPPSPGSGTPQASLGQESQPAGTARLSGRVVAADTGAPVRRAVVALSGPMPTPAQRITGSPGAGGFVSSISMGGARRETDTDLDGVFAFEGLPAGRYAVMVSPPPGFQRPRETPSVVLDEGKAEALTIRVERAGVVAGTVVDESGEPVFGAQVRALRNMESVSGSRWLPVGGQATTNDLGQYRLSGLQQGSYVVSATHVPRGASVQAGPRQGYAPTYHPAALSVTGAERIAVRAGQETAGIDIALQPALLARVTGLVLDSTGQPPAGGMVSVMLRSRSDDGTGISRGASVDPNGRFAVAGVPPGDYHVEAVIRSGGGPNAIREAAHAAVSIDGADVEVGLRTNGGATIEGRVVIEGSAASGPARVGGPVPGAGIASVRLSVAAANPEAGSPMMTSGPPVAPGEDGAFELRGVRGAVRLMPIAGRLPLKSISIAGEDVTGKVLELAGTEHLDGVVVTFSTDAATVEGTVTDDSGAPVPRARVVLYPDDQRLWYPNSPFVRQGLSMSLSPEGTPASRPGAPSVPAARARIAPGGFLLPSVGPGRYLAVAIEASDGPPFASPAMLERLRPRATPIVLVAGQTASVHLTIVKQP